MANNNLSFWVNSELKDKFNALCKEKGTTPGRVVATFAAQFAESGKLPFPLSGDRTYADDKESRVAAGFFVGEEVRKQFACACSERGVPMSIIVRGFMDYCVTKQRFPA